MAYHALWSGRLTADLTRPLGEHTLVSAGRPDTARDSTEQEQEQYAR
ncbi:hypothetical protein [Streptomyces sp. NPDC020996]